MDLNKMKSLTCTEIDTVVKHIAGYFNDTTILNSFVVLNKKGKPWGISGGQCRVYKLKTANGKFMALRIWNNLFEKCSERCRAISKYIEQNNSEYLLSFTYVDNAFTFNAVSYPVILMDWNSGRSLKLFVHDNLYDEKVLKLILVNLLRLFTSMHDKGISHGDLHHDNIRVNVDGALVLIDYDSFFVPSLKGFEDNCKGYSGYQHPFGRDANRCLSLKVDYFSELILYMSIFAVLKRPSLWDEFKVDEQEQSFLFTFNDFLSLKHSTIYIELRKMGGEMVVLLDVLEQYLSYSDINDLEPFYVLSQKIGLFLLKSDTLYCINCSEKAHMGDCYCTKCGCKII